LRRDTFTPRRWGDSHGAAISVASGAGRLAFSVDGATWRYSPTPAFNGTIRFANGTVRVLGRMERPVLLFNPATGAPSHLINGVQPYTWDDYTFTLIQAVAQVAAVAPKPILG